MVLTIPVVTNLVIFTHNNILVVRIAGDLMKPFSVNQRMKIIAMSKILATILILMVLTSVNPRTRELPKYGGQASDKIIKSCVETLVLDPSESEGENGCDVPSCFTIFSNILFDDEYEFDPVDDQPLHNEDFSEKIFSNPLFEEEIISIKKNQHHFNAESDLVESMLNRDSSIISSSSKIDSLLDEFAGQLTSICEMACQIVQKKLEEKHIEEEQAAKAQNRKLLV
nr:hypothetical protein [Tanacetum cinerariifolium]